LLIAGGKVPFTVPLAGATISTSNSTVNGGAMPASAKFSEDIVPLSDMKVNPGRIVRQVDETRRPVLLTNRGRGVAVVQALDEYEAEAGERQFLRDVVQGLVDLEEGRETDLADVKSRLGLT
jgi:prevent-host-death family protein